MSYNIFLDDYRLPITVRHVKMPLLDWTVVKSYNEFIKLIEEKGLPDFISFDHDLADEHYKDLISCGGTLNYGSYKEKTGYEAAKWLVEYCLNHKESLPKWQVHSMNPIGKQNIISLFESYKKSECL